VDKIKKRYERVKLNLVKVLGSWLKDLPNAMAPSSPISFVLNK
jgi:hypothetical protein